MIRCRLQILIAFFAGHLLIAGCSVVGPALNSSSESPVQPVVAVSDFENRSGFSGSWNLGSGMSDVLIDELMDSGGVIVLEREHIDNVLQEIIRQGQDLFRKEGRVERGRLKNAQYLIRGTVTDFHVSGDKSGWFQARSTRLFAGGNSARVTVQLYIVDVESGEILHAADASGKAGRFGFGGAARYKEVTFGGEAFFKTPLGKATRRAVSRAADEIVYALPDRSWDGRIASGGPDRVVINGGRNVRLKEGERFLVRNHGRRVTDPITGNVLEELPGVVVGEIEVTEVGSVSSRAIVLDGAPERGQHLERLRYKNSGE